MPKILRRAAVAMAAAAVSIATVSVRRHHCDAQDAKLGRLLCDTGHANLRRNRDLHRPHGKLP